ncbi:multifunctional procollagen lysine hydroxylase and glycosyltransferase LH3-like [Sycon ciliatum]|uniref:multifunctional procollagen lysine hydroxylase and glycosyltransferase LH3-like n=1 Tax=Sycon ciliatum TaxID=27933 RepID=UPI0031F60AD1
MCLLRRSGLLVLLMVSSVWNSEAEVSTADVGTTKQYKLLLLTIATSPTDGYTRFARSCQHHGVQFEAIGMGEEWRGGDMLVSTGGGQKIGLLTKAAEKYKDEQDLILMYTDSYDVIINSDPAEIIQKFMDFNANMVFAAEGFCWPDESLATKYPRVAMGKRYLNSGGFMGYAPKFYSVVSHKEVSDTYDDQLYYTLQYLDAARRKEIGMRLDHRSHIFQNLNGATDDLEINFTQEGAAFLVNSMYSTTPSVVHGNGPLSMKDTLNRYGNYLAGSWSNTEGCLACKEIEFTLKKAYDDDHPLVLVALFVDQPVPFFHKFLQRIERQFYPKSRLAIFLHVNFLAKYHSSAAAEWIKSIKALEQPYFSVTFDDGSFDETGTSQDARGRALKECQTINCSFYFSVDADVMLTNRLVLKRLVEQNRTILAPLLSKPEKLWSNFWGAISSTGYYERSEDYLAIVNGERRGTWVVPHISHAYLVRRDVIDQGTIVYPVVPGVDKDMAFSSRLRRQGTFMYVTNKEMTTWGHLSELSSFTTKHLHNDMYQITDNKWDWEEEYLHPNYSRNLNTSIPLNEPCPDVYWYPLVTEKLAREMIEEVEHLGEWSGGSHEDKRISGGYENVPTDDIHMTQINFQQQYLDLIKRYILPVQLRAYPGHYAEGKAMLNFVVKYQPDRQPVLRPHHDSSTFTTNVCLNRPHIDYQGGGCRFLRYNCSVVDNKVGWTIMHPGRLTHYHEGLRTTGGTRYILVSFIDP